MSDDKFAETKKATSWADMDDDDMEDFDEKVFMLYQDHEIKENQDIKKQNDDINIHICCTTMNDDEIYEITALPNLYHTLVGKPVNDINFHCILRNFVEFVKVLDIYEEQFLHGTEEIYSHYYESLKLFYHFRHDLFAVVFMMSLNIKDYKTKFATDTKFTDIIPEIKSERTPDVIIRNSLDIIIIEFSVTTSQSKTELLKGFDEKTSKYQSEIQELIKLGYTVNYLVVFLDTVTKQNNVEETYNKLKKLIACSPSLRNFTSKLNLIFSKVPDWNVFNHMAFYVLDKEKINFNEDIMNRFKKQENELLDVILEKSHLKPENSLRVSVIWFNLLEKGGWIRLYNNLLSKNENFNYVAHVSKNNCYLRIKATGLSYKRMMNVINQQDYFTLSKYSTFSMSGHERSPINMHPSKLIYKIKNVVHYDLSHPVIPIKANVFRLENPETPDFHSYTLKEEFDDEKEMLKQIEEDLKIIDDKKMLCGAKHNKEVIRECLEKHKLEQEQYESNFQILEEPKNPFTMPLCEPSCLLLPDNKNDEEWSNSKISLELLHDCVLFNTNDIYLKMIEKAVENNRLSVKYNVPDDLLNDKKTKMSNYVDKLHDIFKINNLTIKRLPKITDVIKGKDPLFAEAKKEAEDLMQANKKINDYIKNAEKSNKFENVVFNVCNKNALKEIDQKSDQGLLNWGKGDKFRHRRFPKSYQKEVEGFIQKTIEHFLIEKKIQDDITLTQNIFDYTHESANFKQLLENIMSEHANSVEYFNKINLSTCSFFAQKMCYNVLYFSQNNTTGNQIQVSNLGYQNVILLVKGGKKIFETQKSRPFRLIFPIASFIEDYKNFFSPNVTFFKHKGVLYMDSKWMTLEERVLSDMSFMYYKNAALFCNTFVRYKSETFDMNLSLRNLMWNYILIFNNRRSTEENIANLRYLLCTALGVYSKIPELLQDLHFIPSDAVQQHILNKMVENYYDYYNEITNGVKNDFSEPKVKHLFTSDFITGNTDFCNLLYCSYGMTKAPYVQANEQVRNFYKMCKIHHEYLTGYMKGLKTTRSIIKHMIENPQPFESDFYFDPIYVFNVGKYLGDFLAADPKFNELHSYWNNFLKSSWIKIENSSGMRGEILTASGEDSFFSRKSTEVVLQEILKDLSDDEINNFKNWFKERFPEMFQEQKVFGNNNIKSEEIETELKFNQNFDWFKVSKELKSFDENFLDKINKICNDLNLKFHVVDKIQWKGSREIFVMSIYTKIVQQPLENFFKKMASLLPNEIISIPSNKRLTKIHSENFANLNLSNRINYKMTLDCRKWGPKSMFVKYLIFIAALADKLPPSFVKYFFAVVDMYYDKQVFLSSQAYKLIEKNNAFTQYKYFLKNEEDLKTCSFNMPYSFVMGIFNYLSSVFHAANQLYAIKNITESVQDRWNIDLVMKTLAHSDDSCGNISLPKTANTELILHYIIKRYEYELKKCNHNLSLKKCVISVYFFEMLSIFYSNNKLLPLTPKFAANLSLKPTLLGYSADQSVSYSKLIEMFANGATLSESWFNMRLYSEMVRRFYNIPYYPDRTLDALGVAKANPIYVICFGSLADDARIVTNNKETFIRHKTVLMLLKGKDVQYFREGFLNINHRMRPKKFFKKLYQKVDETFFDFKDVDFFKNNNIKHRYLRLLHFMYQSKDPVFISSINYESNTRRITRIFQYKKLPILNTHYGPISYNQLDRFLSCFQINDINLLDERFEIFVKTIKHTNFKIESEKIEHIYNFLLSDVDLINESIQLNKTFIKNSVNLTCKPVEVNLLQTKLISQIDVDPSIIYHADDKTFSLFMKNKSYRKEKEVIMNKLKLLGFIPKDEKDFIFYTRKLLKIDEYPTYCYAYVESENRVVNNLGALMKFVETNSCYGYVFKGIFDYSPFRFMSYSTSKKILSKKFIEESSLLKICSLIISEFDNPENIDMNISLKLNNEWRKFVPLELGKIFSDTQSLLPDLALDILNVYQGEKSNFYYSWLSRQRKIGNEWRGLGKIYFKMSLFEIVLNIKNDRIINLEFDYIKCKFDPTYFEFILMILQPLQLILGIDMSVNELNYYLGIKSGVYTVDIPSNLDEIYCECFILNNRLSEDMNIVSLLKNDNILKYKLYNDKVGHHITDIFDLSLVDIKEVVKADEESSKRIKLFQILNPHLPKLRSIENIDFIQFIKELHEQIIYAAEIYPNIERLQEGEEIWDMYDNYKKYCNDNRIDFVDVSELSLQEIVNLDINISDLNSEVVRIIRKNYIKNYIEGINTEIITDFLTTAKTKNPRWDNFIARWGKDQFTNALVFGNIENKDALDNPYYIERMFPKEYENVIDDISHAVLDLFDKGLGNKLYYKNIDSKFTYPCPIDRSHFKKVLFDCSLSRSVNYRLPGASFYLIKNIFENIFDDEDLTESFFSQLKISDNLTKTLPKSPDAWKYSRFLYVGIPKVKRLIKAIDFTELHKLERRSRIEDFELISAKSSSYMDYDRTGGHFIQESIRINFTNNRGNSIELIYKYEPWDPEFNHLYFPMFSYNPVRHYINPDKDMLEEMYEEIYETIGENEDEVLEAMADFEVEGKYYKHGLFDVTKNVDKNCTKNTKILPWFKIIGGFLIDNITWKHSWFVIDCNTLPKDLLLQPRNRVFVYYINNHNKMPSCLYRIYYNIPFQCHIERSKPISFDDIKNLFLGKTNPLMSCEYDGKKHYWSITDSMSFNNDIAEFIYNSKRDMEMKKTTNEEKKDYNNEESDITTFIKKLYRMKDNEHCELKNVFDDFKEKSEMYKKLPWPLLYNSLDKFWFNRIFILKTFENNIIKNYRNLNTDLFKIALEAFADMLKGKDNKIFMLNEPVEENIKIQTNLDKKDFNPLAKNVRMNLELEVFFGQNYLKIFNNVIALTENQKKQIKLMIKGCLSELYERFEPNDQSFDKTITKNFDSCLLYYETLIEGLNECKLQNKLNNDFTHDIMNRLVKINDYFSQFNPVRISSRRPNPNVVQKSYEEIIVKELFG